MAVEMDWDMEELDEPEGDRDVEESLLRYRAQDREVRLDAPISEQAGDETEALALAQVALGLHRKLATHIKAFKAHVKRQKQVLDEWLEHETGRWQADVDRIEERLHEFALEFYEETKTVSLPGATLRRRAYRDRITWDEELARRYQAEHYPEDMNLNKSAMKDRLTQTDDGRFVDRETGEIVDFVRMIEREGESFSVSHEEGS